MSLPSQNSLNGAWWRLRAGQPLQPSGSQSVSQSLLPRGTGSRFLSCLSRRAADCWACVRVREGGFLGLGHSGHSGPLSCLLDPLAWSLSEFPPAGQQNPWRFGGEPRGASVGCHAVEPTIFQSRCSSRGPDRFSLGGLLPPPLGDRNPSSASRRIPQQTGVLSAGSLPGGPEASGGVGVGKEAGLAGQLALSDLTRGWVSSGGRSRRLMPGHRSCTTWQRTWRSGGPKWRQDWRPRPAWPDKRPCGRWTSASSGSSTGQPMRTSTAGLCR